MKFESMPLTIAALTSSSDSAVLKWISHWSENVIGYSLKFAWTIWMQFASKQKLL